MPVIRRREFIAILGSAAVTWPLAARAQQPDRIKRLGILRGQIEADAQTGNSALLEGLASLGWTEGQNLRVDYRSADSNDPAVIRPHAEALVRAAPDVIFASPATSVQVLQRLTRTIPIVFNQSGDPVQAGTVRSLARPGTNLTGFTSFEPSINTKYLQLLKDIAPQMRRVGVLQSQASAWRQDFERVQAVAPSFAITTEPITARDDAPDIERVITGFGREPNGGLILPPDNVTLRHRAWIVTLAAKHRLPAIYSTRRFIEAGGLMYYAAMPVDYRRVAAYIDRILRGAKPSDLPVETPSKFELVINLKTATALGLIIPPPLFALADEVIE